MANKGEGKTNSRKLTIKLLFFAFVLLYILLNLYLIYWLDNPVEHASQTTPAETTSVTEGSEAHAPLIGELEKLDNREAMNSSKEEEKVPAERISVTKGDEAHFSLFAGLKTIAKKLKSFIKSVKRRKIVYLNKKKMDCEGFPDWPLSPGVALYKDTVGAPQCNPDNSLHPWTLHQTSSPDRRPSVDNINSTLLNLPFGTGYQWHSDEDICAFMRTQPLRFQALYNALIYTPHKTDLWRYLLLYQRGGIYLDDDATLLVQFNSSFVESVDSVYMTQGNSNKMMGIRNGEWRPFGFTIYNGLLISKPCNRVLLSVAERMVEIGPPEIYNLFKRTWADNVAHPFLLDWYNLKLLALAIAEQAPEELHHDVNCQAGPEKCTFFKRDNPHKLSFDSKKSVIIYKDNHDWTTAFFDTPQCGMVAKQDKARKHGYHSDGTK